MKHLLTAGLAAATLLAPLTLLTAATAAAPTTTLRPAQIERGPNPKIPHVDGTTVVDGTRRIKVNAGHVDLVGKAGPATYIVTAHTADGRNPRLLRVTSGSTRVLARGNQVSDAELSGDGKRIALVDYPGTPTSVLRVISSSTGAVQHRQVFGHSTFVLEFTAGRVLLSYWRTDHGRTFWWHPATGAQTTLLRKVAYLADAATNRLAFNTGDPLAFGAAQNCSVLTKLSSPSARIWRSCQERVAAISPDASRLATESLIQDGPDSGTRRLRSGTGRLLATFRAEAFGRVQWETNRAALLETHGRTWAATIRCTPTACNRASKLRPSQAGG